MVMLGTWSVLWRENGHYTEVLTFMDICILCILWSIVVFCFLYILPLNLLIFLFLFILHTAKVLHTGEWEDFMPAKIEQLCQSREGESCFDQCLGKHVSLMEREWRELRRWSIQWRENGLTEVVSLME